MDTKALRRVAATSVLVLAVLVAAVPAGAQAHSGPNTVYGDAVVESSRAVAVAEYVSAVHDAALTDFYAEVERRAVVAYVAATYRPPVRAVAPRRSSVSGSSAAPAGGCGGATNGADRFIGRESGGDSTILNGGAHASSPFNGSGRAFGCYQIMPGTWASSCGANNTLGLPPITTYDPASQAACASRLPQSAWGG